MSTWLITGCSSGLGRSLAEAVLARGHSAAITARDAAKVQDLTDSFPHSALSLRLDVTDHAEVEQAVRAAEERFGAVDVLVNNAGYGYRAAIEEGDEADVHALFATHFFGPIALVKAVLPGMRARRYGTIVNVSSIAARICLAGTGYLAAAKAALEATTVALRKELKPLGINAMIVEPGAFRTNFYRSLTQSREAIADYAGTAGGLRSKADNTDRGDQPGDPAKAAQAIITAVESPGPPLMLVLGSDALTNFRKVMDALGGDLDAWERLSISTSFSS